MSVKKSLKHHAMDHFQASISLKQSMLQGPYLDQLVEIAEKIAASLIEGGKLMLCGNGGSAADAQHLAAELLVRLRPMVNRQAIPALSLATDTSTLTACANDYDFECLYERMVSGLGRPGDVLLGITTSGRSQNVIRALKIARERHITTIGFLGNSGSPALECCDFAIVVPSSQTDRIQETHITLGHILMEFIENIMLEAGAIQTI